ncbi:MAG: alpha/beta hydrolase, partial [Ilumatobacteraceae bacterium]
VVFTRHWGVESPKGLILISHGASEHSGRYDRFATALNRAGFAAAALDHRGHGRTGGNTGAGVMGPGGGAAVVDDLHQLRQEAQQLTGAVPTFVFGHSMGSLIALAYLTQHSSGLAGGILCGFPANVTDTGDLQLLLEMMSESRDQSAADLLGDNNASFEPARTRFDWLSRDAAEVDLYLADRYCGDRNPLTYGYLIDLFGVVGPACERLAGITCPVMVIAGDHDAAAAMGAHASVLASELKAAGIATDLTLYRGARHELLNETNRDQVTDDVVDWCRKHRR